MAEKKFTLIGKSLTADEAAAFSPETRFTSAQTSPWRKEKLEDLVTSDVFHSLDRFSMLMVSAIKLQCPVGPHDDPGLAVAVLRACGISKAGSVAVQCTQGHWAEYPCG
jgi:hypothetical protein